MARANELERQTKGENKITQYVDIDQLLSLCLKSLVNWTKISCKRLERYFDKHKVSRNTSYLEADIGTRTGQAFEVFSDARLRTNRARTKISSTKNSPISFTTI